MFRNATQKQQTILIGSILGDSHINKSGGITTAASIKHLDYLQWKHRAMSNLLPGKITKHTHYDNRYKKEYTTARFYIGSHVGSKARKIFYPKGTKIVPHIISLNTMTVAIWLLDDGGLVNRSSFSIATNGFSINCVRRCCKMLSRLGIESHPSDKGRRVAITAKSSRLIGSWMQPIIEHCPSMAHKIDFRHQHIHVPKIRIVCESCGKVFYDYKSAHRKACSKICGDSIKIGGYVTRTKTKVCVRCGKPFTIYNKRQTHCCDCRGLRITPLPCPVCNKPVWNKKHSTCSHSCGAVVGHQSRH